MQDMDLEERVRKLERVVFTVRVAIIIFVGFMIYDIISRDSASDYIRADRVTARQFILLGPGGDPIGYWDFKDTNGFKMYAKSGNHILLTPEAVTFYENRLNPVIKSKYD